MVSLSSGARTTGAWRKLSTKLYLLGKEWLGRNQQWQGARELWNKINRPNISLRQIEQLRTINLKNWNATTIYQGKVTTLLAEAEREKNWEAIKLLWLEKSLIIKLTKDLTTEQLKQNFEFVGEKLHPSGQGARGLFKAIPEMRSLMFLEWQDLVEISQYFWEHSALKPVTKELWLILVAYKKMLNDNADLWPQQVADLITQQRERARRQMLEMGRNEAEMGEIIKFLQNNLLGTIQSGKTALKRLEFGPMWQILCQIRNYQQLQQAVPVAQAKAETLNMGTQATRRL